MKFRVPRKKKKKLNGIFLYPQDEKTGGSLMASPKRYQDDYTAYKQNVLRSMFDKTNAELKAGQDQFKTDFCSPNYMSDEELKIAIDEIFGEEYRDHAYSIFNRAKQHDVAKESYYIFVNAYNMTKAGSDKSLTCCMSLDSA